MSPPRLSQLRRNRYRRLLEAAPDGIVEVDGSSRIVLVNSQAEKSLDTDEKNSVGSSWKYSCLNTFENDIRSIGQAAPIPLSGRCDPDWTLALSMVARQRAGMLIYEAQEGRGIGLMAKLQAYEPQDHGCDTGEAKQKLGFRSDYRDYRLPAAILQDFSIRKIRYLTNNPDKVRAVEASRIEVVERVACEVIPSPENANYLRVKKQKLHYLLAVD